MGKGVVKAQGQGRVIYVPFRLWNRDDDDDDDIRAASQKPPVRAMRP